MNDRRKLATYGFIFILVAALACFIVGFLIVPNLIPIWDDLGPDVWRPRSSAAAAVFGPAGRLYGADC